MARRPALGALTRAGAAAIASGLVQPRPFGTTGIDVSPVGFGAGHIGADGDAEDDVAAVVVAALDAGVTFFDTARGYGRSEERLGRLLPREGIVLSTKVGYGIEGVPDWTAEAVRRGVNEALVRLRRDAVDVVFLHSCPRDVLRRGDVVQALLAARSAGKVRIAGYSGENDALAWAVASGCFGAVQTSVNVADQWSLHHALGDAATRGLGVVAKRPIANAVWRFPSRPNGRYGVTYWDRLRVMGVEPGDGDWLATTLRFSAYAPGVCTAIVGTASPQHLRDAVAAVERGPLPEEERARWRAAYSPEWAGEV